jgi:hypothetical protein
MTVSHPTNGSNRSAASSDATVPWAQQATQQQPRATARMRRMVESLPEWEPLPPGEILVQRHRER